MIKRTATGLLRTSPFMVVVPILAAASQPTLNQEQLEQRARELMVEEYALEKASEAFYEKSERLRDLDEPTYYRFFHREVAHSGAYVENQRVLDVVAGSPADLAGLKTGDQIVEVNDTVADGSAADAANLAWALSRMNPGDLASITYLREGKRHNVQVPLVSREHLRAIKDRDSSPRSLDELLKRQRQYALADQYYRATEELRDHLGYWDGILFISVLPGINTRTTTEIGVLIITSDDRDHPLQAGDIITRIGRNTAADAAHALQLLSDFEDQPLVPLTVERQGHWLEVELPFPEAEKVGPIYHH